MTKTGTIRKIPRALPFLVLAALILAPDGAPQARTDRAKVKAYVDSIWPTLEFVPLLVNGPKDARINIVIINRWTARKPKPYNNPGLRAEFLEDARSVVRAFTPGDPKAVTPVAEYSKFFNIYAIWWPEPPMWDPNSPDGLKEPVFQEIRDRSFLPWKDAETGWVTLMAMLNTDGGGGGAARDVIARTGDAYIAGREIAGFIHEFGHTAPRVSDEYTSIGTWGFGAESNNTTNETRRDRIKWRAWIDPATPVPTPYAKEYLGKVGLFEGGQSRLTNHFRPTAQECLMGAGIFGVDRLCPVCVQHFVERFYQLVDPVESISPAGPKVAIYGPAKVRFAVEHLRPRPDTQATAWILNGKTIAAGTDELEVDFGALPEYELVFRLTDPTPMIRPDPPYAEVPRREVRWTIVNAAPTMAAAPLANASGAEERKAREDSSPAPRSGAVGAAASLPPLRVTADPTPAVAGGVGGRVRVNVAGGRLPYAFRWEDSEVRGGRNVAYPAAAAKHSSLVPSVDRDPNIKDGNLACLRLQAGGGWIEWTVRVLRTGDYPLEILYQAKEDARLEVVVNGAPAEPAALFPKTPEWKEWKSRTIIARLKAGTNDVRLTSPAAPGIDVDTLILPETAETVFATDRDRQGLAPGTYKVVVTDAAGSRGEATAVVGREPGFLIRGEALEQAGPRVVRVARPRPDFRYFWYADDVWPWLPEKPVRPLAEGREFVPPAAGNYYLAARKTATGAESSNRIGFAVSMGGWGGPTGAAAPAPLRPDAAGAKLLLWLDAADTDGDGAEDILPPKRGVLLGWKGKAGDTAFGPTSMVFFQPNRQNGRGLASWETIWLQRLTKPVTGWQTVVLAYREHSLSRTGTAPFSGLSPYLGKGGGRLLADTVAEETRAAAVFLDGRRVDPFAAAGPDGFRILTAVFERPMDKPFDRTDTHWSGAVGEMLVYGGPLTDAERLGIEEYLRRKWMGRFDLERPAGPAGSR